MSITCKLFFIIYTINMNKEEILKLAELARINITEEEADGYKKDFEGILNYLNSIQSVDIEFSQFYETNLTKNSMRDDDKIYDSGSFTDVLLAEAPEIDGDYFKVKKVL